jgi:uncharacterized protein YjbI with pentapeptide repeats
MQTTILKLVINHIHVSLQNKYLNEIPWKTVLCTIFIIYFCALGANDDYRKSPSTLRIGATFDWRLVDIFLGQLDSMAIASAAVLYFKEAPERKKQSIYEAWQVIDNAYASKVETSYARIDALQFLAQENVSLKGIDLYYEEEDKGIDLEGIALPKTNLYQANLRRANLSGANLSNTNLNGADLRDTDLRDANLKNANLSTTKLNNADLNRAKLNNADLSLSHFNNTNLSDADLRDANLSYANLNGATLSNTNLSGCNLDRADLRNVKLCEINLCDAVLFKTQLSAHLSEQQKQQCKVYEPIIVENN